MLYLLGARVHVKLRASKIPLREQEVSEERKRKERYFKDPKREQEKKKHAYSEKGETPQQLKLTRFLSFREWIHPDLKSWESFFHVLICSSTPLLEVS